MAIAPGSQLGTYTVLAPLGAGGMGQVFRARDARLQREVALKLLHDDLTEDPEQLGRFKREARLLAAVNHPNIATIFSLEERDELRFLVMELVPGDTLAERLQNGPLSPAEALKVGRQVAEALEAAHEQGIIHRDLKPENIKITPRGLVKVLDFGLAKNVAGARILAASQAASMVDQPTPDGVLLGTPAYMSPEQARGLAVDHRTDIWALGCILYEALTGGKPFTGKTVCDTLVAILEREPDWSALPLAVPSRMRELMKSCLTKDLDLRLGNVGQARRELEMAAQEFAISQSALGPLEQVVTAVPTIDRAPVPASLAETLGKRSPSLTPTAEEILPVQAVPRRSSRKPLLIGSLVGGAVVVLLGLGLWLAGLFSPKPEPTTPNFKMKVGFDGIRMEGGPDANGKPTGINIEMPKFPGMEKMPFPMPPPNGRP